MSSSEGRGQIPLDPTMTLSDRLEACECFMVAEGDIGVFHEVLADAVRAAMMTKASDIAEVLLVILEREVQTFIFHDYMKGEHREEVGRRVETLRMAKDFLNSEDPLQYPG